MFQIMDGFILVASVDGTILYVSDNVIHYTGFHQVLKLIVKMFEYTLLFAIL